MVFLRNADGEVEALSAFCTGLCQELVKEGDGILGANVDLLGEACWEQSGHLNYGHLIFLRLSEAILSVLEHFSFLEATWACCRIRHGALPSSGCRRSSSLRPGHSGAP